MQTFLPYCSFSASARVLDNSRLHKQRVEVFQILRAITDPSYGWQHHPATNQWRGYQGALAAYGAAVHAECERRGIADHKELGKRIAAYKQEGPSMPPWLGDNRLHLSHQSNLIRKLPEHYGSLFPGVSSDLPYFWPSKQPEYQEE